jgi:hypothetical protein
MPSDLDYMIMAYARDKERYGHLKEEIEEGIRAEEENQRALEALWDKQRRQPQKKGRAMKLTLQNGTEATVGVKHTKLGDGLPRRTVVWFRIDGLEPVETEAVCSLKDNFCKKTGRKLAVTRLLKRLEDSPKVTKDDRRLIFRAVCPEYSKEVA